jgi:hypothetical protein
MQTFKLFLTLNILVSWYYKTSDFWKKFVNWLYLSSLADDKIQLVERASQTNLGWTLVHVYYRAKESRNKIETVPGT